MEEDVKPELRIVKPKKKETSSQSFWFKILLTVVGTMVLGVSSWTLNKTMCMVEELAELRVELKSIKDDKTVETKQNTTLSKHWKLHTWAREEVSAIKHKLEMGEAKWPDFPLQ